jgi:hypothetical protein
MNQKFSLREVLLKGADGEQARIGNAASRAVKHLHTQLRVVS